MLITIHGEDKVRSHQYVSAIKTKINSDNKISFNITEITSASLQTSLGSVDFFGSSPIITLDITEMGRMNVDTYIEAIKFLPKESTLLIFSEKELSPSNAFIKATSQFKGKIIKNDLIDKPSVYKFIDALFTINKELIYRNLRDLLDSGEDVFYIFSLLITTIRNLSLVKFNSPSIKTLNPYVLQKIKPNAIKITETALKNLYKYAYNTDKKIKTGKIDPETGLILLAEKIQNSCQNDKEIHKR